MKLIRIGLVLVIGYVAFFSWYYSDVGAPATATMTVPPPATVRPEPSAEEKAKKAAEDAQWQREVIAVSQLRKGMKNPTSFNLEQALRMADGTLCLSYRATNSFNAIVPGRAVVSKTAITTSDNESRFTPLWNKLCGGKSGTDITYIRRALL
jgi:hypothetical protein